jgi:hypothetical protein
LEHHVLPLTALILVVLFAVQSRGTARIASFFGPVMAVWFVVIGAAGLAHVANNPSVLAALDPTHGMRFLYHHGHIGLVSLGFVFLAVTGGEALYADLGHFGRLPIQTAWFGLVLPSLVINYFGQGALVLTDPGAIQNPFYRLVPASLLPGRPNCHRKPLLNLHRQQFVAFRGVQKSGPGHRLNCKPGLCSDFFGPLSPIPYVCDQPLRPDVIGSLSKIIDEIVPGHHFSTSR